jgi:hypothetical protein
MALDPNIALQAGRAVTPLDLMSSLQQGLQARQAIQQAPLLQKLQEARLAQAQQQALASSQPQLSADLLSFRESIKVLSPEEQEKALRIRLGLAPRAVGSSAITTATTPDLTEQVAESESIIKERTKFSELTGSSRAKKIDAGFDRINNINTGLRNIDRALNALDEGASTGKIQNRFFPSIRAASIKLDNLQNEFALDVISGVTLGAISEAELNLAKEVGLPKDLPPEELKQFLLDKKAAQEKLRSYFEEQIAFLERGGSVADFVEEMKQRRGQSVQPSAPAADPTQQPSEQGFDLEFDPVSGTFK